VRGIRVYVDEIPLSTPDGIATPGNIDLGALKAIEIMRGPFSSLYGSSSGGVINLRTKDASESNEIGSTILRGSYNTDKESAFASGSVKNVDYFVNYSTFSSDGYRIHSENEKDQATVKLKTDISENTKITMLFNWIDQKANDPGGLTAAEVIANRRQSSANNIAQNARVSRDNKQIGLNLEHVINENNTINLITYLGNRNNLQYLYSSVYNNAAYSSSSLATNPSGRASAIARDFWGSDLHWINKGNFLNQPYQVLTGISYGNQDDHRTDDMANNGILLAGDTKYKLRDENNKAHNFDQFIQAQWEATKVLDIHGGLRHSEVTFENDDHLVGTVLNTNGVSGYATTNTRLSYKNADGSGKVNFSKTTPVIGAVFKINPTFNIYANYGKGFETPTFIEMAYSNIYGGGPNFNLKPSTSDNYEIGSKFYVANNTKVNFALFLTNTEKELVSYDSNSAYSVYTNAGKTQRKGIEFSLDSSLPSNFNFYTSYSYLDAQFKSQFTTYNTAISYTDPADPTETTSPTVIKSGNKISGTYKNQVYAELAWKYPSLGFSAALESRVNSRVYVNDANSAFASGYTIYNLRAGFEQKLNNWKVSEFARIENLTDKDYVGSVKNNDTTVPTPRYYEPGAGRNFFVGVSANYQFK
jgi:iron complex outermembrane receptor protein